MLIKAKWLFKLYSNFERYKYFDAVTCWPFIFIRPECQDDEALIAHEMVHYKEQRRVLVLPWLLRYNFSKKFRLEAELRAYKKQIQMGGITIGRAASLLTKYGLKVSYLDAVKLLKAK